MNTEDLKEGMRYRMKQEDCFLGTIFEKGSIVTLLHTSSDSVVEVKNASGEKGLVWKYKLAPCGHFSETSSPLIEDSFVTVNQNF